MKKMLTILLALLVPFVFACTGTKAATQPTADEAVAVEVEAVEEVEAPEAVEAEEAEMVEAEDVDADADADDEMAEMDEGGEEAE